MVIVYFASYPLSQEVVRANVAVTLAAWAGAMYTKDAEPTAAAKAQPASVRRKVLVMRARIRSRGGSKRWRGWRLCRRTPVAPLGAHAGRAVASPTRLRRMPITGYRE